MFVFEKKEKVLIPLDESGFALSFSSSYVRRGFVKVMMLPSAEKVQMYTLKSSKITPNATYILLLITESVMYTWYSLYH